MDVAGSAILASLTRNKEGSKGLVVVVVEAGA